MERIHRLSSACGKFLELEAAAQLQIALLVGIGGISKRPIRNVVIDRLPVCAIEKVDEVPAQNKLGTLFEEERHCKGLREATIDTKIPRITEGVCTLLAQHGRCANAGGIGEIRSCEGSSE